MKLMRIKKFAAGLGTGLLGMTMFVTPVHANVKPEDQAAEAAADVVIEELAEPEPEPEEPEEPMDPLTPEANLATVDDINPPSTAGKQFMTVTTKQGDIFYIIVDRDKDGNENVHFLNQVDDADLQALLDDGSKKAEEEAAAAEAERRAKEEKEAEEKARKEAEEAARKAEEEKNKDSGKGGAGAAVLLILLAAGGVGGYMWYRMKGKKTSESSVPDPDEGYNEDEEQYEYPEDAHEEETI